MPYYKFSTKSNPEQSNSPAPRPLTPYKFTANTKPEQLPCAATVKYPRIHDRSNPEQLAHLRADL